MPELNQIKMLRQFLALSLLLFYTTLPVSALNLPNLADSNEQDTEIELQNEKPISPSIRAKSSVELGRNIIFDASGTTTLNPDVPLKYEWFFGDGNRQEGEEVVHTFGEPGEFDVTLVVSDEIGNTATASKTVFVFIDSFLLISDIESEQEGIENLVEAARKEFIHIPLITSYTPQSDFVSGEALKTTISDNLSLLTESDLLVVWTESSTGLTVFPQIQPGLADQGFFASKDIIFFVDESFGSLENLARGVYQSLEPKNIILTRSETRWALLEEREIAPFLSLLDERGIPYAEINEQLSLTPLNIMSHLVNIMIDRGVPVSTIALILMLPVIVTVVAFMKQVVGLATLGVYTPSILALSFIALDLSFGLLILFSILFIGTLTRLVLRQYRLLYIPRMAIVLSLVSLTILALLFIASSFGISGALSLSVFPMLMMSTMVEKFVNIQSGKGLRSALLLVGEAVLVAILCYYVAEWPALKTLVIGHPEVIFLFIFFNVLLARWSGLRILEYVRFREIIRFAEE